VTSRTTSKFRKALQKLPPRIQLQAKEAYEQRKSASSIWSNSAALLKPSLTVGLLPRLRRPLLRRRLLARPLPLQAVLTMSAYFSSSFLPAFKLSKFRIVLKTRK
jgi:hypothetical protein